MPVFSRENTKQIYLKDPRTQAGIHRVNLLDGYYLDIPNPAIGYRGNSYETIQQQNLLGRELRTLVLWEYTCVFPPREGDIIYYEGSNYFIKSVQPFIFQNKFDCICTKGTSDGTTIHSY